MKKKNALNVQLVYYKYKICYLHSKIVFENLKTFMSDEMAQIKM